MRMNTERGDRNLYKPEINKNSKIIARQNLNRSVDGGKKNLIKLKKT